MTTFISYAHEGKEHGEWVRRVAEDLYRSDIDVVLDQWDLMPGADVSQFMERAVQNASRVVLICTEQFATKANRREGGLGYEVSLAIGRMLVGDEAGPQLIPVVRSGFPAKSLPAFLQSKLYVDFRDDASYEHSLRQLLAALTGKTLFQRPVRPSTTRERLPVITATESSADDADRPPSKWLLVAGTGIEQHFDVKTRTTSEALGYAIARAGYGLVTGGWPGVDETAARSFARALAKSGIPLENQLTQVIADGTSPRFPAGNLIVVQPGQEEWIEPVRRADAVILAGGLGGTGTTGRFGLHFGKAVFPLADTGGDATMIYLEILKRWSENPIPGLEKKQFQIVAREAPGVVDDLIPLLDRWSAA